MCVHIRGELVAQELLSADVTWGVIIACRQASISEVNQLVLFDLFVMKCPESALVTLEGGVFAMCPDHMALPS